jgi:hypothetical protein
MHPDSHGLAPPLYIQYFAQRRAWRCQDLEGQDDTIVRIEGMLNDQAWVVQNSIFTILALKLILVLSQLT